MFESAKPFDTKEVEEIFRECISLGIVKTRFEFNRTLKELADNGFIDFERTDIVLSERWKSIS